MQQPISDITKIYIERLRDGKREEFKTDLAPQFMGVEEDELAFNTPVHIEGNAYVADGNLIVHVDVVATATMPCRICNDSTDVEIKPATMYHVQSVDEITSGVLDLAPIIREQVLVDTPFYAECGQGNCPAREELGRYLVSEDLDNK